jgi:hypothetical protein
MTLPADPFTGPEADAARVAGFLADFAGGRIGQNHNLYQHRARLVRQQAARAKS